MQLPNPPRQPSTTTNNTTAVLAPILEANAHQYATTTFTPEQGELSMPPAKKLAIIACMDARLEPTTILGLKTGDAHVIRNAGGRVSDALRSLIISQQLLGTREVVIMHHTDCGMMTFTDSSIRNTIKKNLDENADHIAFQAFVDLRQSVRDDIRSLVENPLVLDVPISGYIYDVFSGKVEKVQQVGGSVGGGGGGREDVERMLWTKAKKFGFDC